MRNEIRMEALKDRERTFDFAKFRAVTEQRPVVVYEILKGHEKPILQFDAQGNFSEVQVAPLKANVSARLFNWLHHEGTQEAHSHRSYHRYITSIGLLMAYEQRGGRL